MIIKLLKKNPYVLALLTIEAAYIVMTFTACQTVWLLRMLNKLK